MTRDELVREITISTFMNAQQKDYHALKIALLKKRLELLIVSVKIRSIIDISQLNRNIKHQKPLNQTQCI